MRNIKLFESAGHCFILLNESEPGEEDGVRSNQYLITHHDDGVLLDPGGFGVMPRVLTEMLRYMRPEQIKAIFLSHQDPDIVGGLSTWLELCRSPVYVSSIWIRFLPHYGLKDMARFIGVPNEGMDCEPAPGFNLKIVPAHFLHSEGQINVYDPVSKILFTGDIGAAMLPVDKNEAFVDDFSSHIPYIKGFHRRYMCSNKAIRCWLDTIADLDIDMIAPQHGPIYRGAAVQDFLGWLKDLQCGIDLMQSGGRFLLDDGMAED
ncbi:MAG: MBL fold metallo-hydrolase [Methylobacter sp.]|nr:MBL fold metallo-hydrolase [Methylobacter sp.]MDP2429994.1 MBL fold metallo-hydrolase [Methylobacter sp.]MDP3054839.1 MBL fold metallo-hydrolase [Methylobacter sp.]MDP3360581.1 MBL fold metallo-hydrolase [Methylobacter sp.]MDZ4218696.1 MBL fold metallo-hydrolase [Methylobacter sp.]